MSRIPLPSRLPQRFRQRGIALVVALILLVVVTLVGLAAVSGTLGQQKMSANFYDRQVAFQETEAAMRQAALAIEAATVTTKGAAGYFDCSTGASNVCQSNPFTDTNVPSTNIKTVTSTQYQFGSAVVSAPQYIVEYMGNFKVPNPPVKQTSKGSYGQTPPPSTADFYRITARSGDPTASNGRAYVMLQSVFRN